MEYCCFDDEAFPRFDFIQYGQHALSYLLEQVIVNVPLIWVKLLRAINGNPDPYSYSYSCLCERSLRQVLPCEEENWPTWDQRHEQCIHILLPFRHQNSNYLLYYTIHITQTVWVGQAHNIPFFARSYADNTFYHNHWVSQ